MLSHDHTKPSHAQAMQLLATMTMDQAQPASSHLLQAALKPSLCSGEAVYVGGSFAQEEGSLGSLLAGSS